MKLLAVEVVLLAVVVKSTMAWELLKESQTRVVYRPNDPAAQRKIFTYGPLALPHGGVVSFHTLNSI